MGRQQHGPARHQAGDGRGQLPGRRPVQVRGRLVEQQQRRVPQERPGQRDPLALARGQGAAALADHGVVAVRQGSDEGIGARGRGGPLDPGPAGVRAAERDVLRYRAGEQVRQLRHPGDLLTPRPGGHPAERDPAGLDPPGRGLGEPQQQGEQRAFPGSAVAADRDDLARTDLQAGAGQRGDVPAWVAQPDVVQGDRVTAQVRDRARGAARGGGGGGRQRQVEDVQGLGGRGRALLTSVEVQAHRSQRQVRLRREEQHQQRGLVAHVTAEQPQPDLDRDHGGGQRRGQLQHQRGQERGTQRAHGSRPVLVGHVGDHLLLGRGPAEHLERGQPLDDIEEVPAQPGQQVPLPLGLGLRMQADQDREDRDQGHGHRDDQGRDPVRGRDPHQHRDRDHAGQHELGQVAGEVRVQGVQPLGGQGGELARPLPAQPGGPEPERVLGQGPAELGFHCGGGAERGALATVGEHGPQGHHAEQDRQRPA